MLLKNADAFQWGAVIIRKKSSEKVAGGGWESVEETPCLDPGQRHSVTSHHEPIHLQVLSQYLIIYARWGIV